MKRWLTACCLLAAIVPVAATRAPAQQREGDWRDRMEYWRWVETYPTFDDNVTAGRLRAWENLTRAGLRASVIPAPGGQSRFSPLGPFGLVQADGFYFSAPQAEGGRVAAIALHPTERNTFYIGTANGGVWKTTDGGFTWRALTDDQCGLTIGAIAIDPNNPNLVYASTGEPSESSSQACGVLRSGDGGNTWGRVGGTTFDRVDIWGMIAVPFGGSPTGSAVVAATSSGLWRSVDAGVTWTRIVTGIFSDVVGHPTNAAIMYAARYGLSTTSPAALFRSTDAGLTWTELPQAFFSSGAARVELATSPARPDAVYALAGSRETDGVLGIFRWDGDTPGVQLAAGGLVYTSSRIDFGEQASYDLAIAVDPVDANRIYVAGVRAFRSNDGGATFAEMGGEVHVDWHVIRVDPANRNRILAGNDGGIFVSADRGASFQSRNFGASAMMFYPGISVHPTIPGYVLGGLQDNGTIRSGAFSIFEGVTGGDGAYTAINQADPSIFWTSCQRASQQGCLWRHTSGGRTTRLSGISSADRTAFISPLVMSPTVNTRLYFGTFRLYMTNNEGTNWTAQSGDLTKGTGTISSIAESPSDPSTMYVGTSDGNVWVATGNATSFRLATTGLPNRSVTDFAIDASNPQVAWVTVGSFGTSHVFRTVDAGLTWVDLGAGLPDVPHGAVLMIPGTTRVFVGNDLGVYESPTGAGGWSRVAGLPSVRVTDLAFQSRFNLIVAGTYGRGLWGMDIGPPQTALRGDVDRNGTVNAADALLIQQTLVGQPMPAGLTAHPHGDANCDGSVSAADVVVVLRFSVGIAMPGVCVGTIR